LIDSNPGLTALVERLRDANASRRPLRLRGGGSKDFYGETPSGDVLDTRSLAGAAEHEPTELVVTAPAGLRVDALEAQRFGGSVACGRGSQRAN